MQLVRPFISLCLERSKLPKVLLGAFALCVLSGCAFLQPHDDPTRFYVLTNPGATVQPAAEAQFKRWKLGLKTVEMPTYLHSKSMIVRTATNEIHFADFDRWAEPLDQGIGRAMKETLCSAQNVMSVAINSHGEETLDYEVSVRILACEGLRAVNNSSIRFAVAWEVRSIGKNSAATRRNVFTAVPVAWNGMDYGQLAERLSAAIANMSRTVAADLPMEPAAAAPIGQL